MTPKVISARRFGRKHDQPCNDPSVVTCAMWECQSAGACQIDPAQVKPFTLATLEKIIALKSKEA